MFQSQPRCPFFLNITEQWSLSCIHIWFQSQPRCPFFLNSTLQNYEYMIGDVSISTEMPVLPQPSPLAAKPCW